MLKISQVIKWSKGYILFKHRFADPQICQLQSELEVLSVAFHASSVGGDGGSIIILAVVNMSLVKWALDHVCPPAL